MSLLDLPSDDATRTPRVFTVECHACRERFDPMLASWCQCIVKERSLVCTGCGQCFCRSDVDYRRTFWTEAPDALWARKQHQSRKQWSLPVNPSPDEVRRPLVLVVDDDREIRAVAAHLIVAWGLGCIHASDGAEAFALARLYKPEVVLTDALMPKMDGRELCRLIKSDEMLEQTKVIIMSSVYTSGRFKREAFAQFKADEFVSKPIDPKVLFALLRPESGQELDRSESVSLLDSVSSATPTSAAWVPPTIFSDAAEPRLTLLSEEDFVSVTPDIVDPDTANEANEARDEMLPPVSELEQVVGSEESHWSEGTTSLTAAQLIYLRALGLDGEIASLARRMQAFTVLELIALRTAGVPAEFVEQIEDNCDSRLTLPDVITLYSTGCDPLTVNLLRGQHFTVPEIVGLVAGEVPLSFLREIITIGGRRLSPPEIMRLYRAGVELDYLRVLDAGGYGESAIDDWIRVWTVGVPAPFISTASRALQERCSIAEMLRLWLTGVDVALLNEIEGTSCLADPPPREPH